MPLPGLQRRVMAKRSWLLGHWWRVPLPSSRRKPGSILPPTRCSTVGPGFRRDDEGRDDEKWVPARRFAVISAAMAPARPPFAAVVFDAYGTLLDFNGAVAREGAAL